MNTCSKARLTARKFNFPPYVWLIVFTQTEIVSSQGRMKHDHPAVYLMQCILCAVRAAHIPTNNVSPAASRKIFSVVGRKQGKIVFQRVHACPPLYIGSVRNTDAQRVA
jgi:hypothetical protein